MKYLVCGWYGSGNLGDEAILYAISKQINKVDDKAQVKALSLNPEYTKRFLGVDAVKHAPLSFKATLCSLLAPSQYGAMLSAIRWCDVLVFGGGGFLSDWNRFNIVSWLKHIALAWIFGKKIIIYAIGAGPFFTPLGRFITRFVFNNFPDEILIRDLKSYNLLHEIGVNTEKMKITGDPVLWLKGNSHDTLNLPLQKKICIIANPYLADRNQVKFEKLNKSFVELLKYLKLQGHDTFIFPLEYEKDAPFCRDLARQAGLDERIVIEEPEDIESAFNLIKQSSLVISLRLHGSIIAAAFGVPFIPIIYHHKTAEFVSAIDWPYRLEFGEGGNWPEADIDIDLCKKMIESLLGDFQASVRLNAGVDFYLEKEAGNIDALRNLMRS
ncbi:polysaccharide pyruvyl transferase family protein [Chitinibacter sp. S2-10]|uniref:polysaccharide pyruvyl transferase family protein n=1 Tax=Chitinibacter sp. S2-10 TaxID=3373597 RepID=UPI003977DE5D